MEFPWCSHPVKDGSCHGALSMIWLACPSDCNQGKVDRARSEVGVWPIFLSFLFSTRPLLHFQKQMTPECSSEYSIDQSFPCFRSDRLKEWLSNLRTIDPWTWLIPSTEWFLDNGTERIRRRIKSDTAMIRAHSRCRYDSDIFQLHCQSSTRRYDSNYFDADMSPCSLKTNSKTETARLYDSLPLDTMPLWLRPIGYPWEDWNW